MKNMAIDDAPAQRYKEKTVFLLEFCLLICTFAVKITLILNTNL